MARRAVAAPGGGSGGGSGADAGALLQAGEPESWDAERGGDPSSPAAKGRHRRQPATAAVRRALFSPAPRARRLRQVAAAALTGTALLLLVLWAAVPPASATVRPGGMQGTPEDHTWAPRLAAFLRDPVPRRRQAQELAAAGGSSGGSVLVEFTAPGLLIPLKDALDVSHPEHPEERALLQLLPPADAPLAQPATTSSHPTLAQVLHRYQGGSQVDSSSSKENGSGAPGAGVGGGGPSNGRSAGGSPQDRAVNLANEVQSALQQVEEAARRARKERRQSGQQAADVAGPAEHAGQQQGADGGGANDSRGDGSNGDSGGGGDASAEGWEEGSQEVRLLVGVVSACCSEQARQRRAVIRETWGRTLQERFPGVHLRFFLAQAPNAEAAAAWLPALQEDVLRHNDTAVLRGEDLYRNLPNKTLRLLRYTLAHPAGYTHVLKTDDDCYIRIPRILAALRDPLDEAGQPQPHSTKDEGQAMLAPSSKAVKPAGAPEGQAMAGGGSKDGTARRAGHGSGGGGGGSRGGLPATRKQLLELMGKRGNPMYTDGLQLYNATLLVQQAEAAGLSERRTLDDENGEPVTVGQLGRDAAAAAAAARQLRMEAAENGGVLSSGSGIGGQQRLGTGAQAGAVLQEVPNPLPPRMRGVFMGCMENKGGFFPIRDPISKWYLSFDELPDSAVPFAIKYLAGWGVVLSSDMVDHAVRRANLFQAQADAAPAWFRSIPFEDVMVGMLLMDAAAPPQDHPGFRAAWRACTADTAVKHLDVDAPLLFKGLHEQDASGLWDKKPVQCSTGDFLPGDYAGWKQWRDSLTSVTRI